MFNSFEQTFERQVDVAPAVVVPMTMSDEKMRLVYDKLVETNFFSYPSEYSVATPENGIVVETMPSYRYVLTVRNADATHTVAWTDDIVQPSPPEAEQLREFLVWLRTIVRDEPEYAALPPVGVGCV